MRLHLPQFDSAWSLNKVHRMVFAIFSYLFIGAHLQFGKGGICHLRTFFASCRALCSSRSVQAPPRGDNGREARRHGAFVSGFLSRDRKWWRRRLTIWEKLCTEPLLPGAGEKGGRRCSRHLVMRSSVCRRVSWGSCSLYLTA